MRIVPTTASPIFVQFRIYISVPPLLCGQALRGPIVANATGPHSNGEANGRAPSPPIDMPQSRPFRPNGRRINGHVTRARWHAGVPSIVATSVLVRCLGSLPLRGPDGLHLGVPLVLLADHLLELAAPLRLLLLRPLRQRREHRRRVVGRARVVA